MPRTAKSKLSKPKPLTPLPESFSIQAEKERYDNEKKQAFLSAYAEFQAVIGKACAYAEVKRADVNRWRASDPDFVQRMDDIKVDVTDEVEAVPVEIALDKAQEPRDRLAASKLVLEAERPEKYRRNGNDNSRSVPQIILVIGAPPKDDQLSPPTINGQLTSGPQEN